MTSLIPLLAPLTAGATTGALFFREKQTRQNAERLAAALLETLLNAFDANDPETGAHVRRVTRYALILSEAADLDIHMRRSIERVALFHDIGKIHEALFDIIHDNAKLSPAEFRAIATHPRRGADVLAPLRSFYPELPEGVLCHHECWDGSGYPRGLVGEEIPLQARVVSICDSFDAIVHSRRYRAGRSSVDACQAMMVGRCTQFDPDLLDLFLTPPVFELIRRAKKEFMKPGRPDGGRRRKGHDVGAPDISFRWQSTMAESVEVPTAKRRRTR